MGTWHSLELGKVKRRRGKERATLPHHAVALCMCFSTKAHPLCYNSMGLPLPIILFRPYNPKKFSPTLLQEIDTILTTTKHTAKLNSKMPKERFLQSEFSHFIKAYFTHYQTKFKHLCVLIPM